MKRKTKIDIIFIIAGLLCAAFSLPAAASYVPFNTGVNMNVGIGTSTPQGALVVTNGNVGIGTWAPIRKLVVNGANDTDSIRLTNSSSSDSFGVEYNDRGSSNNGFSVYSQGQAEEIFTVWEGGEVAIGRSYAFASDTANTDFDGLIVQGNVGVGTAWPVTLLDVNRRLNVLSGGNIGIGSINPGQVLDVQGTARVTGFALNSSPAAGDILMSNSIGVGSWIAASAVGASGGAGGWTVSGADVYETSGGNVGIGTSTTNQGGALVVTSGNVGIGTWTPISILEVNGTAHPFVVTSGGNVGIGTWVPTAFIEQKIGTGTGLKIDTDSSNGGTAFNIGAGVVTTWKQNGNAGTNIIQVNQGADGSSRTYFQFQGNHNDSGGTNTTALQGFDSSTETGAGSFSTGVNGEAQFTQTSGIEDNIYGVFGQNNANGTGGTATNSYGIYGTNASITHGTITRNYAAGFNGWTIFTGNVGIGTGSSDAYVTTQGPNGGLIVNGNVGLGSVAPSGQLDVEGTLNPVVFDATAVASTLNVGIGSFTPGQKLDVQGTIRTTGFALNGQGPQIGYVLTASDTSGDATWSSAGTSSGWTVSGANVYETSGGNVGIGTSTPQGALVVTNGNVGIGTWAPIAQLDVEGTLSLGLFGGNVGIETTNPGAALEVGGTVLSGTNGNDLRIRRVSSDAYSGYVDHYINVFGDYYIAPNIAGAFQLGAGVSHIDIDSQSHANPAVISFGDTFASTASWEFQHYVYFPTPGVSDYVQWYLNPTSQNYELTRKDSHVNYLNVEMPAQFSNGNVGISSTSPNAVLDVEGSLNPTVFNAVSGTLNVGIGSFTPGQKLDVQGTIRTTGFTLNSNPAAGDILMSNSVGVGSWIAASAVGSGGGGASGWTVSGANVYETSGGNVGIGTTTPQGALVVTNGNVGIGTWTPVGLLDVQGTSSHLYVGPNGNVGIGTWAPPQLLTLQAGSPQMEFYPTASNRAMTFGPSDGFNLIANSGSGDFEIETNNNVWVDVGSGSSYTNFLQGNIGIGSASPGQKLDVQGTVRDIGEVINGPLTLGPSGIANVTAAGGITVTNSVMRIQGNGGAIIITANPQIATGVDGETVVLIGDSNSNTVKINNGTGLKLASGISFTMGLGDTIVLVYDAVNSVWTEISRAANST